MRNSDVTYWLVAAITFSQSCKYPVVFGECGDSVSQLYLSGLLRNDTEVNNFVPSAYFEGSSTKFISNYMTEINHDYLCVDDAESNGGSIQLYDDGTHGDDFANDTIYTRDCIHFCSNNIDFSDIFGYAMEFDVEDTRLVVVNETFEGTVPSEVLDTPLTPDATVIASSHALFFADVNRKYYPEFPFSNQPNSMDSPTGKSAIISALLQVFGDVFDFVTYSPLEKSRGAIEGAGIYKWQFWDLRAGPSPQARLGEVDLCTLALNGIPVTRLVGVISNNDIVGDFDGENHELLHGTSGFEYHNAYDPPARSGDKAHFPGACTGDHSSQQAPAWDWVRGYPHAIPAADEESDKGVRIVANDDCKSCPEDQLTECCSFRYEDIPRTKEEMIAKPELCTTSPLLMYIAGMIGGGSIPKDEKTYYCMGSDVDGYCGTGEDQEACTVLVDDSDRSKVTSEYVSRFTLKDLVNANGGVRYPIKKFNTIRHGAIHVSSRVPSEAEITFYTLLWRHHEIETEPHERIPQPWGEFRHPIQPWNFHTNGNSILHSRLHGIDCGTDNLSIPSCGSGREVCKDAPCGDGAICTNLDGKPLCTCREGLVGDGLVCAFPAETVSYEYAGNLNSIGSECFAAENVWTSFTNESDLPVYPGGTAPYSSHSCGSIVCAPGWKCIKNESKCMPPTGKDMCEGHGYSKSQCTAIGCCKFKRGKCKKRSSTCPPPTLPDTFPNARAAWSCNGNSTCCNDKSTCCYWPCSRFTLDYNDTELSQVNNCGDECTHGIAPDVNGVVHQEFFLWQEEYIANGTFWNYDDTDGPLVIEGEDRNMFNRCYDTCFAATGQTQKARFLLKLKTNGNMVIKNCKWLDKKNEKTIENVCTSNKFNLAKGGYKPASEVCVDSCKPYLSERSTLSRMHTGKITSKITHMSRNEMKHWKLSPQQSDPKHQKVRNDRLVVVLP